MKCFQLIIRIIYFLYFTLSLPLVSFITILLYLLLYFFIRYRAISNFITRLNFSGNVSIIFFYMNSLNLRPSSVLSRVKMCQSCMNFTYFYTREKNWHCPRCFITKLILRIEFLSPWNVYVRLINGLVNNWKFLLIASASSPSAAAVEENRIRDFQDQREINEKRRRTAETRSVNRRAICG